MKIKIATDHLALITIATMFAIAIAAIAIQATYDQETIAKVATMTIAVVNITAIIVARKPLSKTDAKKNNKGRPFFLSGTPLM